MRAKIEKVENISTYLFLFKNIAKNDKSKGRIPKYPHVSQKFPLPQKVLSKGEPKK